MKATNLLTSADAAALLGLSQSRLARLRAQGKIAAAVKVGKGYAYDRSEVERFAALARKPGRPAAVAGVEKEK